MTKFIIIIFGFLSVLMSSCSGYNKIIKGDDYDRKQETAAKYYEAEQWDRAATLYEQIYQRFSKGPKGEESYFRLAYCNYMMEDYYLAGYYFSNFRERFFLSPYAEEATFLGAMCSVKNSPNYSMDQTDTRKALAELQRFLGYYPESQLVDSCNAMMDRLQSKLEKKSYESAKLYDKMRNYRATVTAFDAFVEEYPGTEHREEAIYLAARSQFLLSQNSVDNKKDDRYENTIKRCRQFASLYPESKYLKEVEGYLKKCEEVFYLAIKSQFSQAQNSEDIKKYERYEDTIKRCRKFANHFPTSKYLKEVEEYLKSSEREQKTLSKN